MFAHAISSTNAVTPSSSVSGAFASLRHVALAARPRLDISSGFALNRSSVCGLMPFCSGASTSFTIVWYGALERRRCACSIDTPGFSRANRYAQ